MRMKRMTGLMILGGMGLAMSMMKKRAATGSMGGSQKWEFAQELSHFTEKTGDALIKAGQAINRMGR